MRAFLVVVLAFGLVGAAAARTPAHRGALTLKAPKATSFGHRIEFVGRLVPSRPGRRIAIFRGNRFVAAAALRGDGSYRIPVRLASPGPFRARTGTLLSKPVTVRIVPRLQASLVGAQVVGARLTLVARLEPAQAGSLRVRILRDGKEAQSRTYRGVAHVPLATEDATGYDVSVAAVPRAGYLSSSRTLHVTLRPALLTVGQTSPAVADAARRLAALHYAVPSLSETFSWDLVESVYAFQKVEGLSRTGQMDTAFWSRLAAAPAPRPRYYQPADHIEVDKARQVLFIVRNGQVSLISPISTAGIPGYFTPVGTFAIYRKVTGYDPSPLGVLLDPMYFVGGYAIHGSPSVPPYPASHGCVRVPNFVIYRLFESEPYGETVYVY